MNRLVTLSTTLLASVSAFAQPSSAPEQKAGAGGFGEIKVIKKIDAADAKVQVKVVPVAPKAEPAAAKPAVVAAKAADAVPELGDVQDILFFGEDRPYRVRLHIRVDGRPFQTVRSDFFRAQFEFFDRDGDGVLSKAEAERVPDPTALQQGQFGGFGGRPAAKNNLKELDADGDGKVALSEFVDYYRKHAGGAFRLQAGNAGQFGGAGGQVFIAGGGAGGRTPATVGDVIFRLLDRNKDGKLTADELKRAEGLMVLDTDGDEIVTPTELGAAPQYLELEIKDDGAVVIRDGRYNPNAAPADFFPVQGPDAAGRAGAEILKRWDKDKDGKIGKGDGLSEALLRELDADGDGSLSAAECAKFLDRPADAEATVRIGKLETGQSALEVGKSGVGIEIKKTGEAITIFAAGTELELRTSAGAGQRFDNRQAYTQTFKTADKDNNAYLDKGEAKGTFFQQMFDAMDADGDGKLFEKEMTAYLDRQAGMTSSRVQATVADGGRELFEHLDADRDGRLSIRELRTAAGRLLKLDRDGDGALAKTELPRKVKVGFSRGDQQFYGGNQFVVSTGGRPAAAPAARPGERGPTWFRKMDRNGDGDVSRKEFLGTDEQFKAIDSDGDGLIDADEAEKFDKQSRK